MIFLRQPYRLSFRRCLLVITALVFALPAASSFAANGDVLQASNVLTGVRVSDICYDASDVPVGGSFWVLGEQNGKIYHVSRDLGTILNEIPNPHGAGVVPDIVLSVGIAYRPLSDTLFVLAQASGEWHIKEVDKATGAEIPAGSFTLVPAAAGANLRSLAFDTLTGELWYRDISNHQVNRTVELSASPPLTAPVEIPAAGAIVRGQGLDVESANGETRINVTYGDVFVLQPSNIVQIGEGGICTGIEVPLTTLEEPGVLGIQYYAIGQQRRVAAVGTDGTLYEIEQVVPSLAPPSHLTCLLNVGNQVELTWTNNGPNLDDSYSGQIQILRNGIPFTSVPGTAQSFTDLSPFEGASVYSLRATDAVSPDSSPESFPCEVTVGGGGLVRWASFPGTDVYDIATNPAGDEMFVSDNLGQILHLDSTLFQIGTIPSPWSKPGAVAYVSSTLVDIPFSNPLLVEDALAVANTTAATARQIRFISTDGTVLVTVLFDLRNEDGPIENPVIGGMTFLPDASEFALVERSSKSIVITNQNGGFLRSCVPTDLLQEIPLEFGIAYDPPQNTFLATFTDQLVRETAVGGSCAASEFAFPLSSLGAGISQPSFARGIGIHENTLSVASSTVDAIFQILIAPNEEPFIRGDANSDTMVDATDAVVVANYLFAAGSTPSCLDAADSNDDGILDVSDPTFILFYLFLEGAMPPPPHPGAGHDPTRNDNLGCGT